MRKLLIISASVAIAAILLFAFLSLYGIQTISTDKQTYSAGERVRVSWTSFRLETCTCIDNGRLQILRQGPSGWEDVKYFPGNGGCVDGKLTGMAMWCDVVQCSFPHPVSYTGSFEWDSKTYERTGTVNSCLDPHTNSTLDGTWESWVSADASPGTYKMKFGYAETAIEIR